MSDFNALVGIDFSLIGTSLHAAYEKHQDGYAVLLVPTPQEADKGVSIIEVINDIKKLIEGTGSKANTEAMAGDLTKSLSGLGQDEKTTDKESVKDIIVKLNMAYLYIRKGSDQTKDALEYAFQLQVITKNMIPKEIAKIVDVSNLSLSIWSTDRKKVIEQMQLITIEDYLGITVGSELAEPKLPEGKAGTKS